MDYQAVRVPLASGGWLAARGALPLAAGVLMVRERRKSARWAGCHCSFAPEQPEGAFASEEVPEAEQLLGDDPTYLESMRRILGGSADFQKNLDPAQRAKWLDLEDVILEHISLVQKAFYLAGREQARRQAQHDRRAALLEFLTSVIECYAGAGE